MQITLNKEHEEWLRAQVAAGRFATFDQAVAEAIAGLKSEEDLFAWARPLVDEGLGELERGEGILAEEVFARVEARLLEKS